MLVGDIVAPVVDLLARVSATPRDFASMTKMARDEAPFEFHASARPTSHRMTLLSSLAISKRWHEIGSGPQVVQAPAKLCKSNHKS